MKKHSSYCLIICLIYTTHDLNKLNATGQQSSMRREEQRINFYGELQDLYDNEFSVDNISIAGTVDNIKVYEKPLDLNSDPMNNVATLSLEQISAIRLSNSANPKSNVVRYASRDYIELIFTYKDQQKSEHTYLLETTRKLFCTTTNNGAAIDKELSFEAVKKLTIAGKILREEKEQNTSESVEKKARKEYQCYQAARTVHDLEEFAKKINDPNKGTLEELVINIKDLVGGICNS